MPKSKITYEQYDDLFCATIDGKDVGTLEVQVTEYEGRYGESTETCFLYQVHVDQEYQRQGIGTRLVKEALKVYPDMLFPNHVRASSDEGDLYLTEAGTALMYSCLRKRVITRANIAEPDLLGDLPASRKPAESKQAEGDNVKEKTADKKGQRSSKKNSSRPITDYFLGGNKQSQSKGHDGDDESTGFTLSFD